MKLISHRGNILGIQPGFENMPEYIESAITKGYDVEIDVWYKNGFYLGHDNAQYKVDIEFLKKPEVWCHAKNIEALAKMLNEKDIHCFWHQEDDYTITSKNFIWTYPRKLLYYNSICVLPELGYNGDISKCYGICSDFIEKYKNV